MKLSFFTKHFRPWLAPVLGALGGIVYALVDEQLVQQLFHIATPPLVVFTHNVVDFVLPVIFGIVVGLASNVLHQQTILNQKLSLRNTKLQRDLLVNTLTSLFLHEIRNPVHNVAAALDDTRVTLPDDIGEVVKRNLTRLEAVTHQYRKWGSSFDIINPKEQTEFQPWLKEFIENKVHSRLRELSIEYTEETDSARVNMHALLLDQAFTTLFSNACEALSNEPTPRKLQLNARLQPPHYKKIEITLINHGQGFNEKTLAHQGRSPVESQTGLGLGLTLLRKVLDQVEGELVLSNREGQAEVKMTLPGETT